MPDIIWIALIAFAGQMAVAILGLLQARQTHLLVNSRMTELLERTRSSATAEATLAEKGNQRLRQATLDRAKLEELPDRVDTEQLERDRRK